MLLFLDSMVGGLFIRAFFYFLFSIFYFFFIFFIGGVGLNGLENLTMIVEQDDMRMLSLGFCTPVY